MYFACVVLLLPTCRKVKCTHNMRITDQLAMHILDILIQIHACDMCLMVVENAENVFKGHCFLDVDLFSLSLFLSQPFIVLLFYFIFDSFLVSPKKSRALKFQWHQIWYKNASLSIDMASVELTQSNVKHHFRDHSSQSIIFC